MECVDSWSFGVLAVGCWRGRRRRRWAVAVGSPFFLFGRCGKNQSKATARGEGLCVTSVWVFTIRSPAAKAALFDEIRLGRPEID